VTEARFMAARLGALLLASALAGCATTTPARFYTLTPQATPPAVPPLAGRTILVGPFELPAYLDRPQMAVRTEDGEIRLREFERWAEPLEDAFMRTFTADLIAATGTEQVLAVPIPQRLAVDYRVMARVARFDVDQAGEAVLVVQWYASDQDGRVLLAPRQGTFRRAAGAAAPAEQRVAALSGTIADFAAAVAGSLAGLPAS